CIPIGPSHVTADAPAYHDRLELEYANLRAAMDSALTDPDGLEDGLSILADLGLYFWLRGHASDARAWADRALAKADAVDPVLRARAMLAQGEAALAHLDLDVAVAAFSEAR